MGGIGEPRGYAKGRSTAFPCYIDASGCIKYDVSCTRGLAVLFETKCKRIAALIVTLVAPRKVIVFGSVARGAKRPRDIDLLVVMPDGADCRAVAQMLYQTLPRRGSSLDLVVVTEDEVAAHAQAPWSVIHHALKDGRVLYAA
jgi:predicted nucleotidyltransferase